MQKIKVNNIIEKLNEVYNNPKPALEFSNTFELLVAVVLSAQCTDVRVNKVTHELFKKYNTPAQFAKLEESQLYEQIKSCGLGQSKAKGLIATSRILEKEFGGQVPSELEKLRQLPSVGRKTANVIASVGFGIPAIAVDTHVFRVANRIGLAKAKNVLQTELQLQKAIDKDKWSLAHHLLIFHGRNVCKAQNPQCNKCTIKNLCEYGEQHEQDIK